MLEHKNIYSLTVLEVQQRLGSGESRLLELEMPAFSLCPMWLFLVCVHGERESVLPLLMRPPISLD